MRCSLILSCLERLLIYEPVSSEPRLSDLPVAVGQDVVPVDGDRHGVIVHAVHKVNTTYEREVNSNSQREHGTHL